MDQVKETNSENVITEKVVKWRKKIEEMSHNFLCDNEVELTLSTLDKIYNNDIKIAFIGAPNSGKSSIINRLLERKILPIKALSSAMEFEIRSAADEQLEGFTFEGVSKPLGEIKETVFSLEEQGKFGSLFLTVFSDWLSSKSFVLLEKPPLDPSDDTIEEIVDEYLQNSDLIILVIDALMPVKKAEAVLLKDCVKREIPVIVVLSKMDKISADERNEVISYVKNYVKSCSSDIPVLEIQANVENEVYGTKNLKLSIENLVERVDIQRIHSLQIAQTLFRSLDIIKNTVQLAMEIQKKNEIDKKSEIEKLRQEIDSQNLIWLQIEQKLTEQRQKIEQHMRRHLEANSDVILEKLYFELEKSKDVKNWWNNDMPLQLQYELQILAFQLSSSINQQVASDLKWLQEELAHHFNYYFDFTIDSGIVIDENRSKQRDLLLSDQNQFKIIAKIGTVAIVVMVGTMFITSSVTGIFLATGAVTGLVAEKLIRSNKVKDKEKIRNELKIIISQTIIEYSSTFSQKLRSKYDQINASIKSYNLRWQQTQLQALKLVEQQDQHGNEIDFNDIIQKISILTEDINTEFDIKK